jgi:hypothetical protein
VNHRHWSGDTRHLKRRLSGTERATNSFPQATDIAGERRSAEECPGKLSA